MASPERVKKVTEPPAAVAQRRAAIAEAKFQEEAERYASEKAKVHIPSLNPENYEPPLTEKGVVLVEKGHSYKDPKILKGKMHEAHQKYEESVLAKRPLPKKLNPYNSPVKPKRGPKNYFNENDPNSWKGLYRAPPKNVRKGGILGKKDQEGGSRKRTQKRRANRRRTHKRRV